MLTPEVETTSLHTPAWLAAEQYLGAADAALANENLEGGSMAVYRDRRMVFTRLMQHVPAEQLEPYVFRAPTGEALLYLQPSAGGYQLPADPRVTIIGSRRHHWVAVHSFDHFATLVFSQDDAGLAALVASDDVEANWTEPFPA